MDKLNFLGFDFGASSGRAMLGVDAQKVTFAPEGVNARDQQMIAEAVENALSQPFAVTQSSFTGAAG